MFSYSKGGSKLNKTKYPQWLAAFLACVLVILTGHLWQSVEALESNIMPLTSFTGVYEVKLTGPNGYSQTVDIQKFYQGDNSPVTFTLEDQSFDDGDIDSVAAALAQDIKNNYQFSVTMDYYAGGNTQYLTIGNVTYEQATLIDAFGTAHWAIVFQLNFDGDDFNWRDTGFNNTVYIQVLGAEKELGPGEVPDTPPQSYDQIKRWFPADTPQPGQDHERTDDSRFNNWEGLNLNSGYDNSGTLLWGKQVTDARDQDAWNLYTALADSADFTELENYLNQQYRVLGVFTNWYYEYPAVQWAYDSSLSGVFEADGVPEVRTAFRAVTRDTFSTANENENELGVGYNTTVAFYLYFVTPPEGIEGVTDWIPETSADGSKWIEEGKEEKELTEARDSNALEQWDSENPDTTAFAAWLNDPANGYKKLLVNVDGEGWSEPYDVTWSFDHSSVDVAAELRYYYFKADLGTTVFYGVDGLFGGKSSKTPLKFYIYFSEEYIKPPENIYNIFGWQVLDPNGGNCGEIIGDRDGANTTRLPSEVYQGAPCYDTEYIHLAADSTFQNFDDLRSDAFKEEMEQYIADNFYKDGKISYTLKVGSGEGDNNKKTENWDVVPIKSIIFDRTKTLEENDPTYNRNYDPNRVVAMFKLELADNFYWDNNTTRPVQFYISVTEAALTRNPVTDENVIASHVVNETNHPKTFGGPIIEQPNGITVNLFDYWLEGSKTEPTGTGNLDSVPFYNWTPYNVKWEVARSENVFQSGINAGHLFLFGGGNRFRGWQSYLSSPDIVGSWNFYTGDPKATHDENSGKMIGFGGPNDGIVQNTLDDDGYPVLNLNDSATWGALNARSAPLVFFGASDYYDGSSWYLDNVGYATLYKKTANDASNAGGRTDYSAYFDPNNPTNFSAVTQDQLTESLSYLFSPVAGDYKKVYKDVRGMFRLDEAGYYYYNAPEDLFEVDENALSKGRTNVYGYLGENPEQKTDEDGNPYYQMTLYDEAYGTQFFPFDEWGKSFEYDEETQKVTANRFEPDQYDIGDEKLIQIDNYANNLNHFFGMTLDATFQQPLNGLVNGEDMVFQFSGDDDVWIFIDGVLVGDLGGVHSKSSIEIDYATGVIRIQDRRWSDLSEDEIENLKEKLKAALKKDDVDFDFDTENPWIKFTLYDMFDKAGAANKVDWVEAENGNLIFATNTIHELKFFYLERGHEESNLSLTFNFPETQPDRIQKVDEDGNTFPEENKATFALYEAYRLDGKSNELIPADELDHTSAEFTYDESAPIVEDVTDDIFLGYAELGEETILGKVPLAYTSFNTKFFALVETTTPTGYRTNKPIVLQYNKDSNTLTVVNKYETGAYSSYIAKWTGKGFTGADSTLSLMEYKLDPERNRPFVESKSTLIRDELASGLTVVIPIIKQTDNVGAVHWYPMYGSNTNGWHTVEPKSDSHNDFIEALTRAAVMQITTDATSTRDWYLTWNDYYQRLEGLMENLPGNATRYLNFNPEDGDMSLVPLYLPEAVLEQIIGNRDLNDAIDDDERFSLLKAALQEYLTDELNKEINDIKSDEDLENALEALTKYVEDLDMNGANILDNGRESFNRQPSTVIYVPNEQRELRVRKVDPDGNPVNGAVFAIFNNLNDAAKFPGNNIFTSADDAMDTLAEGLENGYVASYGQTADAQINETLIQSGTLIFRENATDPDYKDGTSPITWPSSRTEAEDSDETLPPVLWLKEIYAPSGYVLNKNLVRIEVGNSAIYANATGYDADGKILTGVRKEKDGITVRAALGKLAQTLVKYAIGNNVDVTLQDITIFEQTQYGVANGALDPNGWGGLNESSFNLHYGSNAEELTGQYGRHSSDADLPFFLAEDGYIRVMPRQAAGHGESTRRDDLTGIDLDSLFSLLNIVVIENERLEASLEISKEVVGNPPDDDEYQFGIKLTRPNGVTASELSGIYNAYIHKTGHQLPVIDENGEPVEKDGEPQYSGPCAPADMEADGHTKLYLYVDGNGDAWVIKDPSNTQNKSSLTLKDGKTYVILGLPEGTGFTITETVTATDDGEYETSVTVSDYLTEDPEYSVTDNGLKISGVLNSADPDDPDAAVPSVKVKYTNKYSKEDESDDPEYGSLSVTKHVETETGELPDNEFRFKIVLTGTNVPNGAFTYTVKQVEEVEFTESVEQASTDNSLFSSISEFIQNRFIYYVADSSVPLALNDEESKHGQWRNGEFEFVLHGGQQAIFSNLPAGITYEVYEETADGWRLVSKTGTNGDIMPEVEAKAVFTNSYQSTDAPSAFDLDISKTVAGNMGNKAETFTFNMVLSNSEHELADFVQYRKGDETGYLQLTDGHYEFTLMHGETITFIGLPEGTQYTITETGADKYGTVITVTEASISRNVNGKEVSDTLNDNDSVAYVNTIDGRVPTNATTVYGWIGAIMITALAVFIIAKRKRAVKKSAE